MDSRDSRNYFESEACGQCLSTASRSHRFDQAVQPGPASGSDTELQLNCMKKAYQAFSRRFLYADLRFQSPQADRWRCHKGVRSDLVSAQHLIAFYDHLVAILEGMYDQLGSYLVAARQSVASSSSI